MGDYTLIEARRNLAHAERLGDTDRVKRLKARIAELEPTPAPKPKKAPKKTAAKKTAAKVEPVPEPEVPTTEEVDDGAE